VYQKQLLLIPGPTPVPPSVLAACSRPMINHRGPEYMAMQRALEHDLAQIFQTGSYVAILTASGTGGLEAAIVNFLSPGDKVLAVSIGAFGDRWASTAKAFGAQVEKMDFEWGQAADPQRVADRLAQDTNREIKAVLFTHNETSTGVTNDLAALAAAARGHGALIMADAISSLVAIDLQTDHWGVDVVVAASQKAFMTPPGLCFVSASSRAWQAMASARMPRMYWDLQQAKDFSDKGQTPWTPAVSLLYGLEVGIGLIKQEGLANIFARHRRLGSMCRAAAQAMGLELLADHAQASNAVTALKCPPGLGSKQIRSLMQERYGVVLAGGQGKLQDSIFRIGHLGFVSETDVLTAMSCLALALAELGVAVDGAAGMEAARQALG